VALWDLIPPGQAKPFLRTNARADGLTTTWPWKTLVHTHRCLVFCDGFFEPEKPARAKGPAPWSYYTRKDGNTFLMAGLFTEVVDPETGEIIYSYTVITTDANEVIRVHDRMPAIIAPEDAETWLFAEIFPQHLLRPFPADLMADWRVPDAAKNPRTPDHPGMIEPVRKETDLFGN
jgi:putative SOS response-associated peptidase YedK